QHFLSLSQAAVVVCAHFLGEEVDEIHDGVVDSCEPGLVSDAAEYLPCCGLVDVVEPFVDDVLLQLEVCATF
ncbi:MAG: hypothetical protein IJT30_08115, partial [Muribaculaceae bacterium]|nr:hypothetical protein [Muribaculaceae bacterium]